MEIKWTPDLETGIKKIDDQHKELIDKICDLLTAMKQGRGKGKVSEMMKFLADYVVEHFSTEEKYMEKYSYEETKKKFHFTQHQKFVSDVQLLIEEYETDGVSSKLAIAIQKKVVVWLLGHIRRVDKELAEFLRDKIN